MEEIRDDESTTEDTAPKKKKRSCNACSHKKIRCNGVLEGQTSCLNCIKRYMPCTFSERKRTGPKSNKRSNASSSKTPTKSGKASMNGTLGKHSKNSEVKESSSTEAASQYYNDYTSNSSASSKPSDKKSRSTIDVGKKRKDSMLTEQREMPPLEDGVWNMPPPFGHDRVGARNLAHPAISSHRDSSENDVAVGSQSHKIYNNQRPPRYDNWHPHRLDVPVHPMMHHKPSVSLEEDFIFIVGDWETQGDGLVYLADQIRRISDASRLNLHSCIVNCSVHRSSHGPVPGILNSDEVASFHPSGNASFVFKAETIAMACVEMSKALENLFLKYFTNRGILGVVGIRGEGEPCMILNALRCFPINFPKVMLSSSDSYWSDGIREGIVLINSIVDLGVVNSYSSIHLSNAATSIVGLIQHNAILRATQPEIWPRISIALSGFVFTDLCVSNIMKHLKEIGPAEYIKFEANGAGGFAMEQLLASGKIHGVLDLTLSEISDEVVGGIMSAGSSRLNFLVLNRIPAVISLGGCDAVRFGGLSPLPSEFASNRKLHRISSSVSLMRTSPGECRAIGEYIAQKLNKSTSPLIILIPEGGLSDLDAPSMPMYSPVANEELFKSLERHLVTNQYRKLIRVQSHINDIQFLHFTLAAWKEVTAGNEFFMAL